MNDCPIDLNRLSEYAMLALEKTQRDVARIADHFERKWERDKALIAKGEERDAAQRAMNEQALRQNEPLYEIMRQTLDIQSNGADLATRVAADIFGRWASTWADNLDIPDEFATDAANDSVRLGRIFAEAVAKEGK